MVRKVIFVFFFLILIGLIALFISRIQPADENRIFVFGNIEVTEVDVSFKIPGKVEKRFVDEGDLVQKGQPVALLDVEILTNEKKIQAAKLREAEANYRRIEKGTLLSDIAEKTAQLESAKADFERIKEDYTRQKELLAEEVISQKEYDISRSSFLSAEANFKKAEISYNVLTTTIQEEKIKEALSQIDLAMASLGVAENHLQDAHLFSPLDGFVISKNIEPGEVVLAGVPIVTIGNLKDIWFRAYVDESDLGKVKLGQKVDVTTDSYPDKVYSGVISFISKQAEFTPKNVETKKERVKLVYRIKVILDNHLLELRPGMPAEGVILIGG